MSNLAETKEVENAGSPDITESSERLSNLEMVSRERYVLGNEIAQGGIGRILRANDKRLERQVALKKLLDPTPETEARFLREALVTARLQHPAIVPVYDVGRFPDGEIFYAMKLVKGRSLGDVVGEARSVDERLALLPHVTSVAEAIAYAHSEGIVHRDLKPDNVLIGPFGETVVIDWGIAKNLREQDVASDKHPWPEASDAIGDGSTSLTMAGSVLGTPGYMPPEQAGGESVDERADVYALGAILYHVLAGVAPYDGKNGFEVLSRVLEGPPLALSTRERRLPRDLLAIVTKAMARDPQFRYPTAKEFAHDLVRFQTGQIVGAYQYSRRERFYRFTQRHRAVLGTMSLGFLVIVLIGLASLVRVLDARRIAELERDRAQEERERAEAKQSEAEIAGRKALQQSDELLLVEARNAARHDPNAAISWLSSLSDSFHRWSEVRLIAADAHEYGISKVLKGHTGSLNMVSYSPDGSTLLTASDDRRVGMWTHEGKLIRMLDGHRDEVWRAIFSNDGRKVLSSSKDGTARLWDAQTGESLHIFHTKGSEAAWTSFLDEKRVAILSCANRRIELHSSENDDVDILPGVAICPGAFALSPDHEVIYYSSEGKPRAWNIKTREFRDYQNDKGRCALVYASPDGKYIGCGGTNGYSELWDAKSGRQIEVVPATNSPVFGTAQFSPDGRLFIFSRGSVLYMRSLENGSVRSFTQHEGPIFANIFSHDGRRLVTTSFDRTAVVWDIANETQRHFYGFRDTACWGAFSPNNHAVAVASWDSTARIFPLNASRNRLLKRGLARMKEARFSDDDRLVVSLDENGTVHVDSLREESAPSVTTVLDGVGHVLSPDATRVVYGTKKGALHIHKVGIETDDELLEGHVGMVEKVVFAAQSNQLLSVGSDKTVRLWDLASHHGRVVFTTNDTITSLAFSNDGKTIAIGDNRGAVRVISTSTAKERTFEGHLKDVTALTFLPGDKRLVSGGQDHTLRIWELESGQVRTLDANGLGIAQILVAHDGSTLYTLGSESSIRQWDVESGQQLEVLRGHRTVVDRIALSPDGSRLVSASSDGEVYLWDLASGHSRTLEGHRDGVAWVAFASRGDRIISAGNDGTVRIWYDDLPFDGPSLRAWMKTISPESVEVTPTLN
ncbi:MAG TPA: protein kinase [Polyangium sp.]|nr:protein kinase [Polyangium sp.]